MIIKWGGSEEIHDINICIIFFNIRDPTQGKCSITDLYCILKAMTFANSCPIACVLEGPRNYEVCVMLYLWQANWRTEEAVFLYFGFNNKDSLIFSFLLAMSLWTAVEVRKLCRELWKYQLGCVVSSINSSHRTAEAQSCRHWSIPRQGQGQDLCRCLKCHSGAWTPALCFWDSFAESLMFCARMIFF